MNEILYHKQDAIATITLNRPENGNRINRKLFFALDEAIDKAAKDNDVRVIIIGAAGDNFCCGFDVGDTDSSLNANEEGSVTWEYRRENTQEEIDLYMKIFNLKKPVIGAVQGTALGGGWLLAMCCDCLIAADNTEFNNAELALGLSYTIYLPFDAWKLPMNIAMEKALTGYPITAEEGLRYGLFNRVVPRAELEEAALKFARRMTKCAPYSLTMQKEQHRMAYNMMGMQNIVPFCREVFNISMHLPGTPQNDAMWKVAREEGGEAVVKYFETKLKELADEG